MIGASRWGNLLVGSVDDTVTPIVGTFGLTANSDFNPDSPVLKNGESITGDALATWQGIRWAIEDYGNRRWVEDGTGGTSLETLAKRDNLYFYARLLATIYNELFIVFRLTGWLKALDVLVQISDWQASELAIGFRNVGSEPRLPRHNYRVWVWDEAGGYYQGTDNHPLDNIRTHAPIAQLLYALKQNIGKTSPGGYNYSTKATFWETYLRDWVKIWQGEEEALGYSVAGTSGGSNVSGWSSHYRGNHHAYYNSGSTSVVRAGVSGRPLWPIQSRHHTHTHVGASTAHYFLGKAIEEFSDAVDVGVHGINNLFLENNMYYFNGEYGDNQGAYPRSLWWTGHDSAGNYAPGSNYISYVVMDMFNLWLDGVVPSFAEYFGDPLAKTVNDKLWDGLSSSQGNQTDWFIGGTKLGGAAPVNRLGTPLEFISSTGQSGTPASPRSNSSLLTNSVCYLLAFDTPDNKMENHIWGNLTAGSWGRAGASSSFYSSSGGGTPLSQPRLLAASIGLLLKQIGIRDWEPS